MLENVMTSMKFDKEMCWKMTMLFCLSAVLLMLPDLSYAQDPIGDTLCTITGYLTGTTGRGIATVAVVFVGIGLFLGKMSWGLAIAVGIGIGAIFGAEAIVNIVGGGTSTCP